MSIKKNERTALWQEHLEKFQSSGLSRRAYCLEHGLKVHQLDYQLGLANRKTSKGRSSFARAVAVSSLSAPANKLSARLSFQGGVALEVDVGASPAWIAQIIAHVGGR